MRALEPGNEASIYAAEFGSYPGYLPSKLLTQHIAGLHSVERVYHARCLLVNSATSMNKLNLHIHCSSDPSSVYRGGNPRLLQLATEKSHSEHQTLFSHM